MKAFGLLTCILTLFLWRGTIADEPKDRTTVERNTKSTLPDANAKSKAKRSKDVKKRQRVLDISGSIDSKAEERILKFVGQHQPEMLKLLKLLKQKQETRYAQALREIRRSQQRLESLARRDKELYEAELALWRVRSQLRLLAAEMSVADEASRKAFTGRLEDLVKQEIAADTRRLECVRARVVNELAKLDTQIRKREEDNEALVARAVKSWQNRIRKQSPRVTKKSRKEK